MHKALVRALHHLPRPLRRRSYLRHMRFDAAEVSRIDFKLAETRSEREQAFRVLHDAYVHRGILDPTPDGLRVSAFSTLPTTTVFIGVRQGQVLSTMSLIEDSPLGLPMEELYGPEVRRLRSERHRIAEVGALAIAHDERHRGLNLMMYNLMFRWAHYYRGIDHLVIAVNPRAADFYSTVILFESLGDFRSYTALRGAPAVALELNLRTVISRLRRTYDSAKPAAERPHPADNLYRFFLSDEHANLLLPPGAGETRLTPPPAWDSTHAIELLRRHPDQIEGLRPEQRSFLLELYPGLTPRRTASAAAARARDRGPVSSRVRTGRGQGPRRVLFFGEAVTLAHVSRPVALARALDPERYQAIVACDPRFRRLCGEDGLPFRAIRSVSSERFLHSLATGSPVYDMDTLREYVGEDLDVIRSVAPDAIVGDFRLSLSISARLANVPYMAITNACWSPYANRDIPLGDHPATKFIGAATAQSLFKIVRPLALAYHSMPLNRVRQEFGLKPIGYDLRKVFTEADYTLYADVPELSPTSVLPANHHFLGPILWSPEVVPPSWWNAVAPEDPVIYVTLGSSGRCELLPTILEALADLPLTLFVATAGRFHPKRVPRNARIAEFLPGVAAAARSRLVICNGGSPTTHQALAAGVPVLGITSNMNQHLNMDSIRRVGAGELLAAGTLDAAAVREAALRMLTEPCYTEAARAVATTFQEYDPAARLQNLLARIPARSRAVA